MRSADRQSEIYDNDADQIDGPSRRVGAFVIGHVLRFAPLDGDGSEGRFHGIYVTNTFIARRRAGDRRPIASDRRESYVTVFPSLSGPFLLLRGSSDRKSSAIPRAAY